MTDLNQKNLSSRPQSSLEKCHHPADDANDDNGDADVDDDGDDAFMMMTITAAEAAKND